MADSDAAARHILVVNDSEEIIELFRDILDAMGHRVTATSYAPDSLNDVVTIAPDLVIMDLVMGGEKHGWQLAQKLRMSRQTETIPIIICTAASDHVREQEGWLTAQGIKVVLKPFGIEDLERAVTKALALPGTVV